MPLPALVAWRQLVGGLSTLRLNSIRSYLLDMFIARIPRMFKHPMADEGALFDSSSDGSGGPRLDEVRYGFVMEVEENLVYKAVARILTKEHSSYPDVLSRIESHMVQIGYELSHMRTGRLSETIHRDEFPSLVPLLRDMRIYFGPALCKEFLDGVPECLIKLVERERVNNGYDNINLRLLFNVYFETAYRRSRAFLAAVDNIVKQMHRNPICFYYEVGFIHRASETILSRVDNTRQFQY
jgi:hypothetical protein